MVLKKKIIPLCLLNSLLMLSASGAQAANSSATVTVSGTVVDNTCTPTWPTSGIPVSLPRASLNDFTGTGTSAAEKSFPMDLIDCGADATSVTLTTKGTADTNNSGLFANSLTSGATGVGLGLFGGQSQTTQLLPNNGNSINYDVVGGKVSMSLMAKLIQSSGTKPTAGKFSSVVTIYVGYN